VNPYHDASFLYGAGIMGALAGFGFGSKAPNKWALILGAAMLWRANQLKPVVDIQARPELAESLDRARESVTSGARDRVSRFRARTGLRIN
jgi:hypothetical protein